MYRLSSLRESASSSDVTPRAKFTSGRSARRISPSLPLALSTSQGRIDARARRCCCLYIYSLRSQCREPGNFMGKPCARFTLPRTFYMRVQRLFSILRWNVKRIFALLCAFKLCQEKNVYKVASWSKIFPCSNDFLCKSIFSIFVISENNFFFYYINNIFYVQNK